MLGPRHHRFVLDHEGHGYEQRDAPLQPSNQQPARGTSIAADRRDHDVGVEDDPHFVPTYAIAGDIATVSSNSILQKSV